MSSFCDSSQGSSDSDAESIDPNISNNDDSPAANIRARAYALLSMAATSTATLDIEQGLNARTYAQILLSQSDDFQTKSREQLLAQKRAEVSGIVVPLVIPTAVDDTSTDTIGIEDDTNQFRSTISMEEANNDKINIPTIPPMIVLEQSKNVSEIKLPKMVDAGLIDPAAVMIDDPTEKDIFQTVQSKTEDSDDGSSSDGALMSLKSKRCFCATIVVLVIFTISAIVGIVCGSGLCSASDNGNYQEASFMTREKEEGLAASTPSNGTNMATNGTATDLNTIAPTETSSPPDFLSSNSSLIPLSSIIPSFGEISQTPTPFLEENDQLWSSQGDFVDTLQPSQSLTTQDTEVQAISSTQPPSSVPSVSPSSSSEPSLSHAPTLSVSPSTTTMPSISMAPSLSAQPTLSIRPSTSPSAAQSASTPASSSAGTSSEISSYQTSTSFPESPSAFPSTVPSKIASVSVLLSQTAAPSTGP